MTHASFVVFEKSGIWAADFRRHLVDHNIRVHESRSWDDCLQELASAPASLLALEVQIDNIAQAYQFLGNLSCNYGQARALLLANPSIKPYRWILREIGAVDILFSWQQVPRAVSLVVRHLSMYPSRDRSLRQQIVDRLSWPDETHSHQNQETSDG